jgi:hypothetical protein
MPAAPSPTCRGVWRIAFDESGAANWSHGIPANRALAIAVPGSWNEQLAGAGFMNFCAPLLLRQPKEHSGSRT